MRRTRPLLLLAIVFILGAVGASYYFGRIREQAKLPPKPQPLPQHLSASANDWSWSHTVEGRPVVEVRARDFRQIKEPSKFELDKVELKIFDKKGTTFDQVRSARAQFDIARGVLFSDGQVEITMGVPEGEAPIGRLVFIRSSGVTFDSQTGKAYTDRPAFFTFDQGQGKSVGASYDPGLRQLDMKSQAEVTWRGRSPGARPMTVEAGELQYKERDAAILLQPWSRMKRDKLALEAGRSIVWLEDGAIRRVEAENARGSDRPPGKRLEFQADRLYMHLTPKGVIERIEAVQNAKLVSSDDFTRSTVTADRLEMLFDAASGDSVLRKTFAKGRGYVEARPLDSKARPMPDTRILRSDTIELTMRAGGQEVETITTPGRGTLEFLPNSPGQKRRTLEGERLLIAYGPQNHVRSFRAANASTRSETPPSPGKPPLAPSLTWSKELNAEFQPATGELARLEQTADFRYEQGERRGRAGKAVYDAPRSQITLEGAARLWDSGGSVNADRILLDQASGNTISEGNVSSTREPERQKQASTGMLSGDLPLQGKARRMTAMNSNTLFRYEGSAVVWQGSNRIRGDWIEIDRKGRRLAARGNVKTQFVEEAAKDGPPGTKRGGGQSYTVIDAPEMTYIEQTRMARYWGGASLMREEINVKAAELRVFLADSASASKLDKLLADGSVDIAKKAPDRMRKGASEHAEYYAGEEKIVLSGGDPVFTDSLRGSTRGRKLTWFADNDRLLVEGGDDRPSVSHIQRK